MILLDTNVLSELMKPEPNQTVLEWVDQQQDNTLYICVITRAEIELGVALLPDGKRKRQIADAAKRIFELFEERCLSFNIPAAPVYAQIVANGKQTGRPISVEDAQIAAIALANGIKLATHNVKHFRNIESLEVIDPWQKSNG